MSCAGHLQESAARREYINKLKIAAVIQNITVEELAAVMDFLREYRDHKKVVRNTCEIALAGCWEYGGSVVDAKAKGYCEKCNLNDVWMQIKRAKSEGEKP